MEGVGYLVGFHPDEARFHRIHGPVEPIHIHTGEILRKEPAEVLEPAIPEGPGASHGVLPEARLGFVNPQARTFAEDRIVQSFPYPLFVQTVPGFVHVAENSRKDVVLMVAGGKANIMGAQGGAEGMRTDIQPSAFIVVSHEPLNASSELVLEGSGVGCVEEGDLRGRRGDDLIENGFEAFGQGVEEPGDAMPPGSRFILVEKGVVLIGAG